MNTQRTLVALTINFIKALNHGLTVNWRANTMPTVGSLICLPWQCPDGTVGEVYLTVDDVIYYALPEQRGPATIVPTQQNKSAEVQVCLDGRDLTKKEVESLTREDNQFRLGEWSAVNKSDKARIV